MLKKGEDLIKNFELKDSPQLIDLWRICFGDDREYIEGFFEAFGDKMKVGVCCEDGKIVSALYCLPAQLKNGEKTVEAWYVYAVATLPEYRRRGFAGSLINELKNADDGKQVLFLTPSSKKNRSFYKKIGFSDRFCSYEFEYEKTGRKTGVELRKIEKEVFFEIREKFLYGCPHVSWSEAHLVFALENNACIAYKNDRRIGYFHFEKTEENYFIDEICALKDCLFDVLEKFCETHRIKKVKVSSQYGEKCCKKNKGMIYCKFDSVDNEFAKNEYYLGLNLE